LIAELRGHANITKLSERVAIQEETTVTFLLNRRDKL